MSKTCTTTTTIRATGAIVLAVVAGCAHSQTGTQSGAKYTTPAEDHLDGDATPNVFIKRAVDGSLVTASGTVVEAGPDEFELDYGSGVITVEMDDSDWMFEGANILEDQLVVVQGRIDDDFYESRSLEASSVYVESLGTHFFASPKDEEDFAPYLGAYDIGDPQVQVAGEVTRIDGRLFVLDTPSGELTVDTDLLPYNPLDAEGYQRIVVGDRVRVRGDMDAALFGNHELKAEFVISLEPNPTKG